MIGIAIKWCVKFDASNSIARCDQPDVAKSTETVRIDEAVIFSRRIVSDTEKIRFTRSGETMTLVPEALPTRGVVSDATAYFTDFCRETDDKRVAFVQEPYRLVVNLAAHTKNGGAEAERRFSACLVMVERNRTYCGEEFYVYDQAYLDW